MGPQLAVIGVVMAIGAITVLRMHREGSRNDVAPLAWPAHYVVQKPERGAFDDACVTRGWRSSPERRRPSAPVRIANASSVW